MEKTIRRYDMDWIRTVAVLLIIPFHASIIFNTNPKAIMYIRSGVNIFGLNIFEMFLDRFQMTLLFFLAGMAAYYSLKKRYNKQFLQTRGKKLFLPVIIGSFTLCPITTYIYSKSQGSSENFIHMIVVTTLGYFIIR